MGKVISVPQWGQKIDRENVIEKLLSCDHFIRSKIIPPPVGSVIFNFQGGRATITGATTTIMGGDCEIMIRGDRVQINGCTDNAIEMFCSIHREIEEVQSAFVAATKP